MSTKIPLHSLQTTLEPNEQTTRGIRQPRHLRALTRPFPVATRPDLARVRGPGTSHESHHPRNKIEMVQRSERPNKFEPKKICDSIRQQAPALSRPSALQIWRCEQPPACGHALARQRWCGLTRESEPDLLSFERWIRARNPRSMGMHSPRR
uniref:Uncharacterized protein n=1 Tax=Arundo donax TaxID=35708 RepID=A0A0A9E650_ARUDO